MGLDLDRAGRMLVSLLILFSMITIAWFLGFDDALLACESPSVETLAIFTGFLTIIPKHIGLIFLVAVLFFIGENVFVNVMKTVTLDEISSLNLKEKSVGFTILTEWMHDWRMVLILFLMICVTYVLMGVCLILLKIIRVEDRHITKNDYRRVVYYVYSVMIALVMISILFQLWISAHVW